MESTPNYTGPFNPHDEQWYSSLYEQEFDTLVYLSNEIIGQQADAQDIVSTIFLALPNAVVKKPEDFPTLQNVKNYLFVMVRNASIDALRKRQRGFLVDVEIDHISNIETEALTHKLEQRDMYRRILGRIDRLPPGSQEILRLFFFEDLSLEEIAARLNLKVESVRQAKYRALEHLRAMVKNNEQPIEPEALVLLICINLLIF